MKVYVICEPCDDRYYPGHPTDIAFFDEVEAKSYCLEKSPGYPDTDPNYYDYAYYYREVNVISNVVLQKEQYPC